MLPEARFDNKAIKEVIRKSMLPDDDILWLIKEKIGKPDKCDIIYLVIVYLTEKEVKNTQILYQIMS